MKLIQNKNIKYKTKIKVIVFKRGFIMIFSKMHGLGNDYIYFDCTKNNKIENPEELAKRLSNRHTGIGGDGIILITKSSIADFKMRMFNSDGTEAEMCGNGIRCVGKFIYDNKLSDKKDLTIETLSGIKKIRLNVMNEKVETVTVNMGEPILEPEKIPLNLEKVSSNSIYLKAEDKELKFTCVSMGNPHAVTIVNNLNEIDINEYGPIIENNPVFPNRTNVEFVEIVDRDNIKMRVWERGTGETLACGTGASASAVACILNNLTNRRLNVHLLGGTLQILWEEKDNCVYMTGTAITVFNGETVEE